ERLWRAGLLVERVAEDATGVTREQVDRDRRLVGGRPHPVDVVLRREERVEVARLQRSRPDALEAAGKRPVELLVLVSAIEADEAPRQVVVHGRHLPRRHDEAEEAERAVGAPE